MKKTSKENHKFDQGLFNWFQGHSGVAGDTSLSRLGLSPKGKAPNVFDIDFKGSPVTFTCQYHVAADADDYSSKYMAVYWGGDQVVYVHFC